MNIAIVKLSALGDIVHASIVLQFIKKHFDDARIDWICDRKFSSILSSHIFIDNLICVDLKDKKFLSSYLTLKAAKQNNYDIVIDMQGLLKSAIIARYLCKNCVGFDRFSIKESIASFFYTKKIAIPYEENIIIRNLTLTSKALGFEFSKDEIDSKIPCFNYLSKKQIPIYLNSAEKNILMIIGSSIKAKIYPTSLQVMLIKFLKQNGYKVWLSFGKDEELKAIEISKKSGALLIPSLDLATLCMAITKFDLVIGPDSGPTHIAWAQNVASITLFGYTPYFRNGYETKQNLLIHTGKKIDAKKLDKKDFCIKEISPIQIANAAYMLLEE